jgi:exodeoxyribonuclease V alpha subunit
MRSEGMENVIEMKIIPDICFFYSEDTDYGIYACKPEKPELVCTNRRYGTISLKGNTVRLELGSEYQAKFIEKEDKKYGTYYEIVSIYEDVPMDIKSQRSYLLTLLTEKQVDAIYNVYPNENILELIRDGKFDYEKVKGMSKKSFDKIQDKLIENIEFKEAYDFFFDFELTNNFIIKLVKHFKSAKLLIEKVKENAFVITAISGIGFKKADKIAMALGHDPQGKYRMLAAIEHVVEEESNAGHTYVSTDKVAQSVHELTSVDFSVINEYIYDTDKLIVIGDRVALKKNYESEKYIADRVAELLRVNEKLDFNVEEFIKTQEEKQGFALTDQQKQFFYNVRDYNFNILTGFAGCGKSQMTALLIELLEDLKIDYKLLSPTAKAARVLSGYTGRKAETIHRGIGLGMKPEDREQKTIDERFIIVDEVSMKDVVLGAKLLSKCSHPNVRILYIGDPAQISSVSAGNVLHDMIESKKIPVTKLDIVFRQKEGGMLDIITKIRLNQKFVDNDFWGIKEFGDNCTVACVPQEKVEGGYQYYINQMLKEYTSDDITVATPTKKSNLGTVNINKHMQTLVNDKSNDKKEKEYGFDKVTFREGDLLINTVNSYEIMDIYEREVDIVNGDIGRVKEINEVDKEVIVEFDFATIPFPYSKLSQLMHCWALTIHKLQGSSNSVIIVVADKSHKFQLNNNLLYTACTRPTDKLIIISQAETINYAMRKKANLQRNTFLKDFLVDKIN